MDFLDQALTNAARSAKFGTASNPATDYVATASDATSCPVPPDGYVSGYYVNPAGATLCVYKKIDPMVNFPQTLPADTPPGLWPSTTVVTPNPTVTPLPTVAPMNALTNFYNNNKTLSLGIAAAAVYFFLIKK